MVLTQHQQLSIQLPKSSGALTILGEVLFTRSSKFVQQHLILNQTHHLSRFQGLQGRVATAKSSVQFDYGEDIVLIAVPLLKTVLSLH